MTIKTAITFLWTIKIPYLSATQALDFNVALEVSFKEQLPAITAVLI